MNTLAKVFKNVNNSIIQTGSLRDSIFIINKYNGLDWLNYENFNQHGVQKINNNDYLTLYLMRWKPGKQGDIHATSNSCLTQILRGELIEKRFPFPNSSPLFIPETKVYKNKYSRYIDNTLNYQSFSNYSNYTATSLHLCFNLEQFTIR